MKDTTQDAPERTSHSPYDQYEADGVAVYEIEDDDGNTFTYLATSAWEVLRAHEGQYGWGDIVEDPDGGGILLTKVAPGAEIGITLIDDQDEGVTFEALDALDGFSVTATSNGPRITATAARWAQYHKGEIGVRFPALQLSTSVH